MSVEAPARPAASGWRRALDLAKRALLVELAVYANIGRFLVDRKSTRLNSSH